MSRFGANTQLGPFVSMCRPSVSTVFSGAFSFLTVFACFFCLGVWAQDNGTTVAVDDSNNYLIYQGELSADANQSIFDLYALATVKPTRLVIASGGGDIQLGMDLGEWVYRHQLDIEIDYCYSSCANFVFPAAKHKYLRKDSRLLWHGSAWQASWDNDVDTDSLLGRYIKQARQRESAFYQKIGVKRQVATYGEDTFSWYEKLMNYSPWAYDGFDYSIADMQRWGIANIMLIDEQWNRFTHQKGDGPKIKRVVIAREDYQSLGIKP